MTLCVAAKNKVHDVCTGLPDMSYFDSYHVFEEHLDFLADLQSAFVKNSELFDAGESLEGRPLKGIHLWGRDGPGTKPAIIWHATVHAREWITAPVRPSPLLVTGMDALTEQRLSSI